MEIKVGLFVAIGTALIGVAILLLGGADSIFTRRNTYLFHAPTVEGLISGAKVVIGGLHVGTVESVDFDDRTKDIVVELKVGRRYAEWIRKDSRVEIMTQGVLGDKFVAITSGTQEEPILANGAEIPYLPSKDLSQFLSKGDQLMVSLQGIAVSLDRLLKSFESGNRSETIFSGMAATAKNLSQASAKLNTELDHLQLKRASGNLNQILEKINNGTGTLGALVNDPGLYYDAKALMGGANRNRIIRNLVRKTIKDAEEAEAAEAAPGKK
jgi:phospholipid/cholesterol/gamma-HCH transport system substrate-binding protein